jgi:hypothetical protein
MTMEACAASPHQRGCSKVGCLDELTSKISDTQTNFHGDNAHAGKLCNGVIESTSISPPLHGHW